MKIRLEAGVTSRTKLGYYITLLLSIKLFLYKGVIYKLITRSTRNRDVAGGGIIC